MASPTSAVAVGRGARGRKGGKSSQKKQPQRGMGVAQLEMLRQQEQLQRSHLLNLNNQFHPKHHHHLPEFNSLQLHGFPQFTSPPHMDPYEERRVRLSPAAAAMQPELPSIPNADEKKKKVVNGVDDLDAYLILGRDTKYYQLQQGVQVLAVHPKERNVVMEYGFFPVTPNSTNEGSCSASSSSAYAAASATIPAAPIDLSLKL